jgi:hypothetical protein
MQGSHDRALAVVPPPAQAPAPAWRVLAEVAEYLEQHPGDQPPLGDRTIQFQAHGDSHAEKMTALWAFARFLDAKPEFRNEVWFVQRRFGQDGCSITLDMHYTPDPDEAFRALQRQAAERDCVGGAA